MEERQRLVLARIKLKPLLGAWNSHPKAKGAPNNVMNPNIYLDAIVFYRLAQRDQRQKSVPEPKFRRFDPTYLAGAPGKRDHLQNTSRTASSNYCSNENLPGHFERMAVNSRFLGCCDLLGEHLLQVCSPRGRATSDRAGTNQAKMGLELALENDRIAKRTVMKADCCHRFLPAVSLCALLSGCAYPVKISCPAEASIHPALRTSSPI